MADEHTEADTPPEDTGERLTRLEDTQAEQGAKLDAILDKLGSIVPGSHAEAQQRQEEHLDRPSSVAEQVQAELRKAAAAQNRAAAEDDHVLATSREVTTILVIAVQQALGVGVQEIHGEVDALQIPALRAREEVVGFGSAPAKHDGVEFLT